MQKTLRSDKWVIVVLMLLANSYAWAQESVPVQVYVFEDSLQQEVNLRHIPQEVIAQYHTDEAFDYRYGYQQTVSFWEQLWSWVLQQLSKLFGEVNFSFPIDWLLYIFCVSMIMFAVLRLTGVSISTLFNRQVQQQGMNVNDVLDENIHELNFEEEISKAQQANDYRRAIRLLYIYTLKKLTDNGLIEWQPGKTNADYQRELSGEKIASDFRSLSIYYEYAWYGEFAVDSIMYDKVDSLHRAIDHQLVVSI